MSEAREVGLGYVRREAYVKSRPDMDCVLTKLGEDGHTEFVYQTDKHTKQVMLNDKYDLLYDTSDIEWRFPTAAVEMLCGDKCECITYGHNECTDEDNVICFMSDNTVCIIAHSNEVPVTVDAECTKMAIEQFGKTK